MQSLKDLRIASQDVILDDVPCVDGQRQIACLDCIRSLGSARKVARVGEW